MHIQIFKHWSQHTHSNTDTLSLPFEQQKTSHTHTVSYYPMKSNLKFQSVLPCNGIIEYHTKTGGLLLDRSNQRVLSTLSLKTEFNLKSTKNILYDEKKKAKEKQIGRSNTWHSEQKSIGLFFLLFFFNSLGHLKISTAQLCKLVESCNFNVTHWYTLLIQWINNTKNKKKSICYCVTTIFTSKHYIYIYWKWERSYIY